MPPHRTPHSNDENNRPTTMPSSRYSILNPVNVIQPVNPVRNTSGNRNGQTARDRLLVPVYPQNRQHTVTQSLIPAQVPKAAHPQNAARPQYPKQNEPENLHAHRNGFRYSLATPGLQIPSSQQVTDSLVDDVPTHRALQPSLGPNIQVSRSNLNIN
jgi:hypothetical protein